MKIFKGKARWRHQRAFFNHDNRESQNAHNAQIVIIPETDTVTGAQVNKSSAPKLGQVDRPSHSHQDNVKSKRVATEADDTVEAPELSIQLKLNLGEMK